MYGQEDVPKDVLEYVVFEKHLTNPYGSWRMHGKVVPPWAPPKQPILKVRQLVRFKRAEAHPGWCGSMGWALPCKLRGPQFDSWSGHMPGLQARSQVGLWACERQLIDVSLIH